MKPMRLRINTDIVTEFLPPRNGNSDHAIIVCDGLPSVPSKRRVLEYWSKRGFWVFHPRYKGTWESSGKFLDHDPTEDIIDVVGTLRNGTFHSILPKTEGSISQPDIRDITVLGASFGGAVAILSSLHPNVDRVVAISPVIDWASELTNPVENISDLQTYIRYAFGEAYRFSDQHFERLGKDPDFFNPIAHVSQFDPRKIFIMAAKDDIIVSYHAIVHFIEQVQCSYKLYAHGGHLSSSLSTSFFRGRALRRFILGA